MKRIFSILLALVLVLVCGMQIAAYVGDIVSPHYEVCPFSPDGHHDFSETGEDIDYEDYSEFFHINNVTVREKCSYCGKLGDSISFYRESGEHTYTSHFDSTTEKYIFTCTACGRIYP